MQYSIKKSTNVWWRELWKTDDIRQLLIGSTSRTLNWNAFTNSYPQIWNLMLREGMFQNLIGPIVKCKLPKDWRFENVLEKESNTHTPPRASSTKLSYHWWAQLAFLLLYKEGLIYRRRKLVLWCNECCSSRNYEEVTNNHVCLYCLGQTEAKDSFQWYLRSTKFVNDSLFDDEIFTRFPDIIKLMKNLCKDMDDQLISCQEYWRVAIPIVYCFECGEVPLPIIELPIRQMVSPSDTWSGGTNFGTVNVPSFLRTRCPECHELAVLENDTLAPTATWFLVRLANLAHKSCLYDSFTLKELFPSKLFLTNERQFAFFMLYTSIWDHIFREIQIKV